MRSDPGAEELKPIRANAHDDAHPRPEREQPHYTGEVSVSRQESSNSLRKLPSTHRGMGFQALPLFDFNGLVCPEQSALTSSDIILPAAAVVQRREIRMKIDTTLDDLDGLLDWPSIDAWIVKQPNVPGDGPITAARKLSGGLQNSVVLVERRDVQLVLRRPSKRAKPNAGDTMRREARVLQALAGSDVPHPGFYAICEDEAVTGAVFYIMENLEGFAKSGELPGRYAQDPAWRKAMGEALVDAAVALGRIDYDGRGLSDLGKPESWHERQVERWRKQLEGYAAAPGYNPKELPHFQELGSWLEANLPDDRRIGLMHGDLQFPNVMFSLQAPRVSGIIDWELVTLGDPMIDLGWILSSWLEPGDPVGKKPMVTPWDGFASRAELAKRYCRAAGRDEAAVPWFLVLACYKLACLLEGTVAAAYAGKVPEKVGLSIREYTTWLTTKGRQVISGEGL